MPPQFDAHCLRCLEVQHHSTTLCLDKTPKPNASYHRMVSLASLQQDTFLQVVPYLESGPSALLRLGLVCKFFGSKVDGNPSLVEMLANEMVRVSSPFGNFS